MIMSSVARMRPTSRGRRCVPPPPGTSPSFVSGSPRRALSAAITGSQASTSSKPPPSANPCTAAITGFRNDAIRSVTLRPMSMNAR